MFRTALKSLLGHKLRLVITALAVTIGVAFMAGTFVLTDTIGRTFDQLFVDMNRGVDVVVRERAPFASEFGGEVRPGVPVSLIASLGDVDGVRAAEGNVQASVQILDRKGKPVADPARGFPTFGSNWLTTRQLNPFDLVDGRPPRGPEEVVIDRDTAGQTDLGPGDTTQVLARAGSRRMMVVGVATVGGADNLAGAGFALMETAEAVDFFGTPGQVDFIAVVSEPGVGARELESRLQRALPEGTEAITGSNYIVERQTDVKKQLTVFNAILQAFALVALVAGAFLIYNTFGIIVAQRTRELAMLRALGASRRQVVGSVLLEALVVGLVAAALGLLAGLGLASGLRELFRAFGVRLPSTGSVLLPRTVVVSLLVGVVVTVVSAVLPAWRAARVAPVAAMREVAVDESSRSIARRLVGVVVLAVGAAAMVSGTIGAERPRMLVGAGLVFVAMVILGPVTAPLIVRTFGAPLPRLRGITGNLARENALRNPRRTASTSGALILAVLLVTVISIFTTSFQASINAAIDRNFSGDLQVDSGAFSGSGGGLSPTLATRLSALPELGAVTGVRSGTVAIDDKATPVFGFDGVAIEELARLGVTAGRLRDLGSDGIAVKKETAERHHWTIGSRVPVTLPNRLTQVFRVAALFTDGAIIAQGAGGDYFIDLESFAANLPGSAQLDLRVIMKAAPGVSAQRARATVERITEADFPSAKVQDQTQIKAEQSRQINQNLSFILVMLGLSVVIGVLGIANTLALSTYERTREIGLLRAVGMSRAELRSSIRWEAVLISMLGTAVGLALGLAIGSALLLTYRHQLLTARLNFPWVLLGGLSLAMAVFGVLAAILPGRRAARLDVLRAVTVE